MADIRIKDLTTTASSTASDDFFAADGTTNGTRKLSAYSPSFGGNATVGGTLTVNGTGSSRFNTTTGFAVSTSNTVPSGGVGVGAVGTGGSFFVNTPSLSDGFGSGLAVDGSYPGGVGAQSVVNIKAFGVMSGGGYGSTLSFQTTLNGTFNEVMKLTSGSVVQVLGTTASTTTSSGALVVSGGVGVAGSITLGGGVNIAGAASDPLPAGTSGVWTASGSGLRINSAGYTFASLTGTSVSDAKWTLNATTASSSTSTGALVVGNGTSGGLGVGGDATIGGSLTINRLYTPTQKLEVQIPHTVSTENYLRVASNNGANTYGGEYGYGLTSGGSPEIRINRVHANTATNVITIPTSSGNVTINTTTASTGTSSGALVVSGGVGVAKEVYVGTTLKLANTSQSVAAWGDIGAQLSVAGAVITDTSSSGTVSRAVVNSIAASALAASSTTTYTQAASLFVAGAPTANTNVTITNAYAIYTAGGRINFQGLPTSSAGLQAGTLWNDGGTLKVA